MPFRTGNSSTPVIITNKGTQQRTALPNAHPCRKVGRSVSKRATKGSQQWANTTKKQAVTRSKSIHPMFFLLFISIFSVGFIFVQALLLKDGDLMLPVHLLPVRRLL